MNIKDLIGYQLVSIDDAKIIVCKDNTEYTINIMEDHGGCCGYNSIETKLFISDVELKRNPIITNVELDNDADRDGYDCKSGNLGRLTFFGEYKPMAQVDTYSSSGSGWWYGASVSVYCNLLGIEETLSSW